MMSSFSKYKENYQTDNKQQDDQDDSSNNNYQVSCKIKSDHGRARQSARMFAREISLFLGILDAFYNSLKATDLVIFLCHR